MMVISWYGSLRHFNSRLVVIPSYQRLRFAVEVVEHGAAVTVEECEAAWQRRRPVTVVAATDSHHCWARRTVESDCCRRHLGGCKAVEQEQAACRWRAAANLAGRHRRFLWRMLSPSTTANVGGHAAAAAAAAGSGSGLVVTSALARYPSDCLMASCCSGLATAAALSVRLVSGHLLPPSTTTSDQRSQQSALFLIFLTSTVYWITCRCLHERFHGKCACLLVISFNVYTAASCIHYIQSLLVSAIRFTSCLLTVTLNIRNVFITPACLLYLRFSVICCEWEI